MPSRPQEYRNRVYAGWLGKCIGVRLGAPLENWTYDEIRETVGEVTGFLPLPPGTIFKPDDDTAFPMIMIRALEEYGPAVSAAQMGETVLNYLADQRGTFWWGGYGISTEHTAYANLANGIPAPLSGSAALNGKIASDQIGGQIFSDIWGLVAPDEPTLAADFAAKAASVTHDGEGINGGRFIAGLVSHAFVEADPVKLVEMGLTLIPQQSEYARVTRAVLDFYRQQPDDWRACYRFIVANFGYDRYAGVVHIIPNAGIVVMALLYSGGDFSRAICIATMGGWDTDCNVGNVGAIMGVAVGLEGIDQRWRAPMNDLLITASLIGTRNLLDIPACADLFWRLGAVVAGESAPPRRPRCHFDYPGSTHGFISETKRGSVVKMRQVDGQLQIAVRKLNKKGEICLFVRSYIRPSELSANHYKASFSPTITPGQCIAARLFLPADAPTSLRAGLFVWDDNHQQHHQATAQPLIPGRWCDLHYTIPMMENALLSKVGVVIRNLDEPWTGHLLLDMLDWRGPAHFATDFSHERAEYDAISQWTFLRGYWRLEKGAYHGSGVGVNESYTGDVAWRDYEMSVRFQPLLGQHHLVLARVQGARRSYAIGLGPDDQLVLYKNEGGYTLLAAASFPWQHHQSYDLTVRVEGSRISAIVGDVHLEWIDDSAYLNGQIGFANLTGCHTAYEKLEVKANVR